jgi:hypothetical protein
LSFNKFAIIAMPWIAEFSIHQTLIAGLYWLPYAESMNSIAARNIANVKKRQQP